MKKYIYVKLYLFKNQADRSDSKIIIYDRKFGKHRKFLR